MQIAAHILDAFGRPKFQTYAEVDAMTLIIAGESREDMAREKGATWTARAIPVFAQELLEVFRSGARGRPVEKLVIEIALIVWVFDHVFNGLDASAFLQSDLIFTITQDGTVKYDRRMRT